jgi:hypothetical protein
VQRDPARDLADDLPPNGIVVSCGTEDRARVVGLRKLRLATAARQPSGERRDGGCAGIVVVAPRAEREVELPGRSVTPAVKLAPEDESRAEAGTHREERKVGDPARHALPELTERREVDVVLELHRHVECALQLTGECPSLEAFDVAR